MEVQITVHLTLDIPENKKIPVEQLTYSVHNLKIEKHIVQTAIQGINHYGVETRCHPKSQPGNGELQFQRAGTTTRDIVTIVGEINLKLSKVKDTYSNKTSIPLYDYITFDGKRKYQPDISMAAVDLAGKLSYRDVVKTIELLIDISPTPTTVNQRVVEYGERIPINS